MYTYQSSSLLCGVTLIVLGLGTALISYRPGLTRGVRAWAYACSSAGFAMLLLQDEAHWFQLHLSYTVAAMGCAFILHGMRMFFKLAPAHWQSATLILATAIMTWIAQSSELPEDNATASFSLVLAMFAYWVWKLCRKRTFCNNVNLMLNNLGRISLVFAAIMLIRAVLIVSGAGNLAFWQSPLIPYLYFAVQILLLSMASIFRLVGKLNLESRTDSLAGTLNRFGMEKEIQERRRKLNLNITSVLLIDIDNFKAINDQYGHPIGDQVIRHCAGLLRTQLRHDDRIARWGGEEFCVLLSGVSADNAKALAEKLRLAISNNTIETTAGTLNYTVSIGFSLVQRLEFERAIEKADTALYAAKKAGKNCTKAAE